MKIVSLILLFASSVVIGLNFIHTNKASDLNSLKKSKLESNIEEVKKLVKSDSNYNPKIAFFIDMSIPSGKNRFFVYDLKTDKIIDKGLVAHGTGSETGIDGKLIFSNTANSLATSLGKYSIGKSYEGQFGKAYKLYGLDPTNSNAYDRNIVLHKFHAVPYSEQKEEICNSHGCPMVNEKFYKRIEKTIDSSKKRIILDIFY